MKTIRRLEIKNETRRLTVIRQRGQSFKAYCGACREDVAHFRVAHAAALFRLSETVVFRLCEAGNIHSRETDDGVLLVCSASLVSLTKEINGDFL